MLPVEQFRRDLQVLIAGMLPEAPVIWFNQDGPRPPKPYVSLFALSPSQLISMSTVQADTGVFAINSTRRADIQFGAYGLGALDLLALMQARFYLESSLAAFNLKNIAVWDAGDPSDVTVLLDTRYESRAIMDCVFAYTRVTAEDIPPIEQAVLNGQLIGGA